MQGKQNIWKSSGLVVWFFWLQTGNGSSSCAGGRDGRQAPNDLVKLEKWKEYDDGISARYESPEGKPTYVNDRAGADGVAALWEGFGSCPGRGKQSCVGSTGSRTQEVSVPLLSTGHTSAAGKWGWRKAGTSCRAARGEKLSLKGMDEL